MIRPWRMAPFRKYIKSRLISVAPFLSITLRLVLSSCILVIAGSTDHSSFITKRLMTSIITSWLNDVSSVEYSLLDPPTPQADAFFRQQQCRLHREGAKHWPPAERSGHERQSSRSSYVSAIHHLPCFDRGY